MNLLNIKNKNILSEIDLNHGTDVFYGTFVTVGTSNHDFSRLIESVYNSIDFLPKPIIIQYGYSKITDGKKYVEHRQFLCSELYNKLIKEAEVLISHAGAGTILDRNRSGRMSLIMARDPLLGEHVDNHQAQLTKKVVDLHLAIEVSDDSEIKSAICQNRHLNVPPKIEVKREGVFSLNENVLIVASLGGHKTEATQYKNKYESCTKFRFLTNKKRSQEKDPDIIYLPQWNNNAVLPLMIILMFIFLLKNRDIKTIFTTGSNIGFVALLCGFFLGKRLVALDTITRISDGSLWFRMALFLPNIEAYVHDWAVWPRESRFFKKIKNISVITSA